MIVKESISFKRGVNPKKSLDIGLRGERLFEYIGGEFKKIGIFAGRSIYGDVNPGDFVFIISFWLEENKAYQIVYREEPNKWIISPVGKKSEETFKDSTEDLIQYFIDVLRKELKEEEIDLRVHLKDNLEWQKKIDAYVG
jgi:hypothetical protein